MTQASSGFFPEITPYQTHNIAVGDGHTLYVEQSGNPEGLPVIVLHGGPGSGCKDTHRQRFNPAIYRIVCFDQRGCGRSTWEDRLAANTTPHLVDDIETIRTQLGLGKVVIYGTSWGSTLALAYAQTHPQQVLGMVLGGIFLCTPHELAWMTSPAGVPRFHPAEYRAVVAELGNPPPEDILETLHQALTGNNEDFAQRTATLWSRYEAVCSDPAPNHAEIEEFLATATNLVEHATMEAYYFVNDGFLEPNQLADNTHRIAHLPVHILQGAIDMVCPPETAIKLHGLLPNSTLTMVPLCGHSGTEDMEIARTEATNTMAAQLAAAKTE